MSMLNTFFVSILFADIRDIKTRVEKMSKRRACNKKIYLIGSEIEELKYDSLPLKRDVLAFYFFCTNRKRV